MKFPQAVCKKDIHKLSVYYHMQTHRWTLDSPKTGCLAANRWQRQRNNNNKLVTACMQINKKTDEETANTKV